MHRLLVDLKYKALKRLEGSAAVTHSLGTMEEPKMKRRKHNIKKEENAQSSLDTDNAASEQTPPKNRFEGYQTQFAKEAKTYYPDYFFKEEFCSVAGYHGMKGKIFDIFEQENKSDRHSIITKYEAALRLNAPSMRFMLGLLHCALIHLRAGVSASHIVQFAVNGSIPYLNAFSKALSLEQQASLFGLNFFFSPTSVLKTESINI